MKKYIWLYTIGFVLSLVCTTIAFGLVWIHSTSPYLFFPAIILIAGVLILAMLQLLVQLFFFLHIGEESSPKWNMIFLISTFSAILIIVVASLWIMGHLNYNMTPSQINSYINSQSGF